MQMSSADPAPLFWAALWETVNFSCIYRETWFIKKKLKLTSEGEDGSGMIRSKIDA